MHPQVRWVIRYQFCATLGVALVAGLALGASAAVSAMFGGGIAMASALVYAWRAMRSTGVMGIDARRAFNAQMAGEGYKFAVTLLLFAVVFKNFTQLAALPLFLAYVASVTVYWVALLRQQ